MHFRHPSYPSISASLLSFKKKQRGWELMPAHNSTDSQLNAAVMKRHIMFISHQGLFLKQYGGQILFLSQVYHKVSSFLYFLFFFFTYTLYSTG